MPTQFTNSSISHLLKSTRIVRKAAALLISDKKGYKDCASSYDCGTFGGVSCVNEALVQLGSPWCQLGGEGSALLCFRASFLGGCFWFFQSLFGRCKGMAKAMVICTLLACKFKADKASKWKSTHFQMNIPRLLDCHYVC